MRRNLKPPPGRSVIGREQSTATAKVCAEIVASDLWSRTRPSAIPVWARWSHVATIASSRHSSRNRPEPPGSAEQGLRAGTAERSLHRQQGDSERGFLVPPFEIGR